MNTTENVTPWRGVKREAPITFKIRGGKEQQFVERYFLNAPESVDTGSAKLDFTAYRKGTKAKGYYWSLSGSLELRDCETRIDLSFSGNTKNKTARLQNSRQKLERLKSIAETGLAVIDAMEAAQSEQ